MTVAMILCAGFGTRLGELTKDTPKPLLKLGNKPILEHTIRHLKRNGVSNIVINLHYMGDMIRSHFENINDSGIKIDFIYEDSPLGTAGAVKNAQKLFENENDFFVIYGDIVTNLDFQELIKFHKSKNDAIATIILHERAKSNSIVEIDHSGKILKFLERPPQEEFEKKKQNWVNSGIYCLNKKIFDYLPDGIADFPKDIFPELVKQGSLYGFPLKGYRMAVDSAERYFMLQFDYQKNLIY